MPVLCRFLPKLHGGHSNVIEHVQAEDLSAANLEASDWNDEVIDKVVAQLTTLGYEEVL